MSEPSDLERAVLADPELMQKITTSRAQLADSQGVEDPEHSDLVFSPAALASLPSPAAE